MVHEQLFYTRPPATQIPSLAGSTSWLESMKSGRTKYKVVNCSDRKVRVFGDVAIITGRAATEAEINGQPRSLRLVFLKAWTRTPKGWNSSRVSRRRK